jgi:DMSO/TMAO reductase YedYZ molybdopterin-dependent catalytic subunit
VQGLTDWTGEPARERGDPARVHGRVQTLLRVQQSRRSCQSQRQERQCLD